MYSALQKDNNLNVSEMFNTTFSGYFYKTTFSFKIFQSLCDSLRFNDKQTHIEKWWNNTFEFVREIWDIFVRKWTENYESGSYLTIEGSTPRDKPTGQNYNKS